MTLKKASWLATQEYFEQKLSIKEIAEKRDLSEATIFKHLEQIINNKPEFDISYLQPSIQIIESVEKAQKKLLKEKSPDNFLESGALKLKALFTELDEKVSYDDIKLALLFLD